VLDKKVELGAAEGARAWRSRGDDIKGMGCARDNAGFCAHAGLAQPMSIGKALVAKEIAGADTDPGGR